MTKRKKNGRVSDTMNSLVRGDKMQRWKIKRWILEEYEEYADTREDAMAQCDDPASITITKETCIKEDL